MMLHVDQISIFSQKKKKNFSIFYSLKFMLRSYTYNFSLFSQISNTNSVKLLDRFNRMKEL